MLQLQGKHCKDCVVFTDNIEPEALAMVFRFLDNPMLAGAKIRIMPDVHAGNDIVVGFTMPVADSVNPDHVGGDIGCSVSTAITATPVDPERYPVIEQHIRQAVKFGMATHGTTPYPIADLHKHLNLSLQNARQRWSEMFLPVDVSESGITAMLRRLEQDEQIFYRSIGSVGGGNHFVEIGITGDGNYAITIHCGSRNFGQKVWRHWKTVANERGTLGFLTGDDMKGYLTDMVVAQAYAEFNHRIIADLITNAFAATGETLNIIERIHTTHNYIDFGSRMLRKGAVAADERQKLVIPFNMRDGLIIAIGKGNPDWNCSAPHGAGRILSRSEAKRRLSLHEFKQTMTGVYSTSVDSDTLDESPMAYKDTDEILRLIADTVDVESFVRPVISLKASAHNKSDSISED